MPALGQRATHCKHGHSFTPENTRFQVKRGYTYQRCMTCARNRAHRHADHQKAYLLMRRYGLTKQQRSSILVSQDGLCALCYERPATEIDHDHVTGRIRGMLCKPCNVALGVLADQQPIANTLEYLTREEAVT